MRAGPGASAVPCCALSFPLLLCGRADGGRVLAAGVDASAPAAVAGAAPTPPPLPTPPPPPVAPPPVAPGANATGSPHRLVTIPGVGRLRANHLVTPGARGGVIEALNIPFAAPPLGRLRFRPPQPGGGWAGTRDATRYGPGCMQRNATFPTSEDCLQLNVWAPSHAPPGGGGWPVLVWAFGGGLVTGSGVSYNGTKLARLGMVVVTMNYRVGALGFYASMELAREDPAEPTVGGMNGVLDILASLRWVRAHVGAFRGDAGRVTVSGVSSGAVSSCILAFAPRARGLFRRVILESGACTGPWLGPATLEENLNVSAAFAADVACRGVAELRRVPAQRLVDAANFVMPNFCIDGYLLDRPPAELPPQLPAGGAVLLGGNTADTTCLTAASPPHPTTAAALRATLADYFAADAERVLAAYLPLPPDGPLVSTLWLNMSRDAGVTCPTMWLARRLSAEERLSAWLYQFGYNATSPGGGVAHGGEVPFVWQRAQPTPAATALSAGVGEYWASFVRSGAPRGPAGWPEWPAFPRDGAPAFIDFHPPLRRDIAPASASHRYHHRTCAAWEAYTRSGPTQLARFNAFGYLC